ncbi:hypothetical protein AUJ46_01540 [Candidatus Peregrinibacteria bacterium CG1_02_54_53]|nr:MAG: hypothetical protein AUJ46_01540 [Candidatus Peregrinibacteria bacterium CG1_02_54_53]
MRRLRILETEDVLKRFELFYERLKLPLGLALKRESQEDGTKGKRGWLNTEGEISEQQSTRISVNIGPTARTDNLIFRYPDTSTTA